MSLYQKCNKCCNYKLMKYYDIGWANIPFKSCIYCKKKHDCTLCDDKFISKAAIKLHYDNKHADEKIITRICTDAIIYKCSSCNQEFDDKEIYVKHASTCRVYKYYCFECEKSMCNANSLSNHKNTALHQKKYKLMYQKCFLAKT
jgi:hypothetical protein